MRSVSSVHLAWELSASGLLKVAVAAQVLPAAALHELLQAEVPPECAGAGPQPVVRAAVAAPELAGPRAEVASELAGARVVWPEQVARPGVAESELLEAPELQAGTEQAERRGESHAGFPLEVEWVSHSEVEFRASHLAEGVAKSWPPGA